MKSLKSIIIIMFIMMLSVTFFMACDNNGYCEYPCVNDDCLYCDYEVCSSLITHDSFDRVAIQFVDTFDREQKHEFLPEDFPEVDLRRVFVSKWAEYNISLKHK